MAVDVDRSCCFAWVCLPASLLLRPSYVRWALRLVQPQHLASAPNIIVFRVASIFFALLDLVGSLSSSSQLEIIAFAFALVYHIHPKIDASTYLAGSRTHQAWLPSRHHPGQIRLRQLRQSKLDQEKLQLRAQVLEELDQLAVLFLRRKRKLRVRARLQPRNLQHLQPTRTRLHRRQTRHHVANPGS